MQLPKPTTFLIIGLVIISGAGFFLFQSGYFYQTPITFVPPYPTVNINSDPVVGVFEGRVPCYEPNCEKIKTALVLYGNKEAKTPTTYWLGRVLVDGGNEREVSEGAVTIWRGIKEYPNAIVYALDDNAPRDTRLYWRVDENILLPLDQNMDLKVGNASWGYMLSRTD